MSIFEEAKKLVDRATGMARPETSEIVVHDVAPEEHTFATMARLRTIRASRF
jgi:hypothetical protein